MFLYLIEHKDTKAQSYVLCEQIFESPKSLCSIIFIIPFLYIHLKMPQKYKEKNTMTAFWGKKTKKKA